MSAAIDANVLLYASDEASRFRPQALDLLRKLADGPGLLYLFWPVIMSYLRLATHPSIFERPLPPEMAAGNVAGLLSLPHVRAPGEEESFWNAYLKVTGNLVVRGNLVPDAHLVALMRSFGVSTIWSHDRDFRRFEGVRVLDPFQ